MKLSEQLKRDHESGEFGKALEGYSDRAKKLERIAWEAWVFEAVSRGAKNQDAAKYADDRLREI